MGEVDNSINGLSIKISKNYGFVQTLDFYLFPDLSGTFPYYEIAEYSLVGLSNPEVGLQNLTWFDVNDFDIGDEIHVLYESISSNGDEYRSDTTTKKSICKYLGRSYYPDSIVYTYYFKESVNDTSFTEDTVTTTIKADTSFDKLPGEPVISGSDGYFDAFSYYMTNGDILSKEDPGMLMYYTSSNDTCFRELIADGCLPTYTYQKGLGGPYYSCTNGFESGKISRELVYYKKGDNSWGTELNITGITEVEQTKNISIYPNPANDFVYVNYENNVYSNYSILIYNIEGRLLKSEKLEMTGTKLDVSDLSAGVYFVKISNYSDVVKIDKLVIE